MPFLAKQKQKEHLVRKILQIQARYRVLKYDTFSARGGQGLHIFPVFPVFINPNYMGGGGGGEIRHNYIGGGGRFAPKTFLMFFIIKFKSKTNVMPII